MRHSDCVDVRARVPARGVAASERRPQPASQRRQPRRGRDRLRQLPTQSGKNFHRETGVEEDDEEEEGDVRVSTYVRREHVASEEEESAIVRLQRTPLLSFLYARVPPRSTFTILRGRSFHCR